MQIKNTNSLNKKRATPKYSSSIDFSIIQKHSSKFINKSLQIEIKIAKKRSDIIRCQYLIAETYNKYYKIFFSTEYADLNANIEPYPHKYLMGIINNELIGCVGIYLNDTYIERFGYVQNNEISDLLIKVKADKRYKPRNKKELTKLVVKRQYIGTGIAHFLAGAAHSKYFININSKLNNNLVVSCGKLSVFDYIHKKVGISTRTIKEFPSYGVHRLYSSPRNPMESRLIIPELDIPKKWYNLKIPGEYVIQKDGKIEEKEKID